MLFECSNCSQSLDAPDELQNQVIECPGCKQVIQVPTMVLLPAGQIQVAPASPRRIFKYVFWGTISLGLTIVILVVGMIFGLFQISRFLIGVRNLVSPPASTTIAPQAANGPLKPTVNYLGPLSPLESNVASQILKKLHVQGDTVEGITWYSLEPVEEDHTGSYLYIASHKDGSVSLRWRITYDSGDWLFIKNYRIRVDQDDTVTLTPNFDITRRAKRGFVTEIFDEPSALHTPLINRVLAGKTAQLRMQGRDSFKDIDLDHESLQQMRTMLLIYGLCGGKWLAP